MNYETLKKDGVTTIRNIRVKGTTEHSKEFSTHLFNKNENKIPKKLEGILKLTRFVSILGILLFIWSLSGFAQPAGNSLYFSNEDFQTNGDFVNLGSPDYKFKDKLTVAVWVKWTINPPAQIPWKWANIVAIDRHNTKGRGQFWLQHDHNNSHFEWAVYANHRKSIYSTTEPDSGKYYYLTGVYDGSADPSMKFYIDGVLEATASFSEIHSNISHYHSNLRMTLGKFPGIYRYFTGSIDELQIWKRALTQEEIRRQMFEASTVDNTDLVSYWDFNQSSGTMVDDKGTQNVDGTFYTALVEVNSFTTSPYTITDSNKYWMTNQWSGKTICAVAGAGVDEVNTLSSNTSDILTFQNAWLTTPILSGAGNMTSFGIEDPGQISQWRESCTPIGESYSFVNTTTPATVGPAGGNIQATIISTPSSDDNIGVYYRGSLAGEPVTSGEVFPGGITSRSNIVWGVYEWGDITANLIFDYTNVPGINNPSSLKLLRKNIFSNIWIEIDPTSRDDRNRTLTIDSADTFYEYALGGDNNNPLPVELYSFTAEVKKGGVFLEWETKTEVNNYGFKIQRSEPGVQSLEWKNISFIEGHGNSNSPKEYSYLDDQISYGNFAYRLKQIDNDGTFEYSDVIEINAGEIPGGFVLEQNYPNPFNPLTKIKFATNTNVLATLKVFDVLGNYIDILFNEKTEAGAVYEIDFDGSSLSSGVYIYMLQTPERTVSRKMLIIK